MDCMPGHQPTCLCGCPFLPVFFQQAKCFLVCSYIYYPKSVPPPEVPSPGFHQTCVTLSANTVRFLPSPWSLSNGSEMNSSVLIILIHWAAAVWLCYICCVLCVCIYDRCLCRIFCLVSFFNPGEWHPSVDHGLQCHSGGQPRSSVANWLAE